MENYQMHKAYLNKFNSLSATQKKQLNRLINTASKKSFSKKSRYSGTTDRKAHINVSSMNFTTFGTIKKSAKSYFYISKIICIALFGLGYYFYNQSKSESLYKLLTPDIPDTYLFTNPSESDDFNKAEKIRHKKIWKIFKELSLCTVFMLFGFINYFSTKNFVFEAQYSSDEILLIKKKNFICREKEIYEFVDDLSRNNTTWVKPFCNIGNWKSSEEYVIQDWMFDFSTKRKTEDLIPDRDFEYRSAKMSKNEASAFKPADINKIIIKRKQHFQYLKVINVVLLCFGSFKVINDFAKNKSNINNMTTKSRIETI